MIVAALGDLRGRNLQRSLQFLPDEFRVLALGKYPNQVNRFLPSPFGPQLNPGKYREVASGERLEILNPCHIHPMVIGNRDGDNSTRLQSADDLLVGRVFGGVVEG